MTLHKKIILQLAFHANKRKYSHAFGKLCHVRMFLDSLMTPNIFTAILDRMDVASVERITRVNKLYAFTHARMLGPYLHKRRNALVVKNFWRLFGRFRTTSKLSKLFVVQGKMTDADMRLMSFQEMFLHLRDPNTISIARRFMDRALKISTSISSTAIAMRTRNVRVFLAAFPVVYFTTGVFEEMGQKEQSVLAAAGPLLACVFNISAHLAGGARFRELPRDLVANLPRLVNAYEAAFAIWKPADEKTLGDRIVRAWAALFVARRQALPEFMLFDEIDEQIERMRTKYGQIMGQKALDVVVCYLALVEEIEDVKDNMLGVLI